MNLTPRERYEASQLRLALLQDEYNALQRETLADPQRLTVYRLFALFHDLLNLIRQQQYLLADLTTVSAPADNIADGNEGEEDNNNHDH